MNSCQCALPTIYGSDVCKNCINNEKYDFSDFPKHGDNTWTYFEYPSNYDFSTIYTCRKCGNMNQEKIEIKFNEQQNLLDLNCKKCGYRWKEDPKDKEEK